MPDTALKEAVSEYIRNSPIAAWQSQRRLRTPQTIADNAALKGYSLRPPQAINSDRYSLYRGKQLIKEGSLNMMNWYLDKEQGYH